MARVSSRDVLLVVGLPYKEALASAQVFNVPALLERMADGETWLRSNMRHYDQILSWWRSGTLRRTARA